MSAEDRALASELQIEDDGTVAVITLDNPPVNALPPSVFDRIEEMLEEVDRSDCRCVVLHGAGRCFASGADIRFLAELDQKRAAAYLSAVQAVQEKIQLLRQPVVAALHGAVLGGGCELAMACDIRICDEATIFGFPEVTLGVIPGAGGTQALPRLIGLGMAKRLVYSGERITAGQAHELGLVEQVVPSGNALGAALELARAISRNAPLAVAAAKRSINLGSQMSLTDGLRLEATLFTGLVGSADMTEGTNAFLQKRPARFEGR
jgi:enoyl-CoA hydratase